MTPPRSPDFDITIQRAAVHPELPSDQEIVAWVDAALGWPTTPKNLGSELTVRFVSLEESQQLNHQFRGHDKPTNVLSFPAHDEAEDEAVAQLLPVDGEIGDLAVCVAKVEQEAKEQGKTFADHCAHLVIHGSLHCLGYRHDTDVEAKAMEALEIAILAQFNIANPYGEHLVNE